MARSQLCWRYFDALWDRVQQVGMQQPQAQEIHFFNVLSRTSFVTTRLNPDADYLSDDEVEPDQFHVKVRGSKRQKFCRRSVRDRRQTRKDPNYVDDLSKIDMRGWWRVF